MISKAGNMDLEVGRTYNTLHFSMKKKTPSKISIRGKR